MIINPQSLRGIFVAFNTLFTKAFEGQKPNYEKVATVVPSTADSETYAWLGDIPGMREWVGDREIQNLSGSDYVYRFKRPSVPSYDRYIKSASQSGITKASKVFMLDAVIDEDKDRLTKDMEENPGIAITIGNKLTEILGLTNTANLKKL